MDNSLVKWVFIFFFTAHLLRWRNVSGKFQVSACWLSHCTEQKGHHWNPGKWHKVCQSKKLQYTFWIMVHKIKTPVWSFKEQSSLLLHSGNSKLQNDSARPQKRSTESAQWKTRWHLLVIGWLTAATLLLSSQLDTWLSVETWLTWRQLYRKMQLGANCGNICVLIGDVFVWICAPQYRLQASFCFKQHPNSFTSSVLLLRRNTEQLCWKKD